MIRACFGCVPDQGAFLLLTSNLLFVFVFFQLVSCLHSYVISYNTAFHSHFLIITPLLIVSIIFDRSLCETIFHLTWSLAGNCKYVIIVISHFLPWNGTGSTVISSHTHLLNPYKVGVQFLQSDALQSCFLLLLYIFWPKCEFRRCTNHLGQMLLTSTKQETSLTEREPNLLLAWTSQADHTSGQWNTNWVCHFRWNGACRTKSVYCWGSYLGWSIY